MQVDSFFTIGTGHHVCEDYCLHSEADGLPFAILSDGCSSSRFTDFGARFLCLAAREALQIPMSSRGFRSSAVMPYARLLVNLRLPWSCLDATLAVLYCPTDSFQVDLAGDGIVVARKRNGDHEVFRIEFSNNAPGYLTYLLDNSRYAAWINTAQPDLGGVRTITHYKVDSDFVQTTPVHVLTSDQLLPTDTDFWYRVRFPRAQYDLVAMCSDGVDSFERTLDSGLREPVSTMEILQQLLSFKNTKGQFVTRRSCRFFRRFCPENRWHHYDDVTIVAMYDDEDTE